MRRTFDPSGWSPVRLRSDRKGRARTGATAAVERPLFGILAMLVSTALFPLSDMLAKALTADVPALEVAWMRYAVFVLLLLPALLRGRAALQARRPAVQLVRGTASALATTGAILGFSVLPVADATAIGFITPVIVTGLAVVVLKESVGWRRWLAAALGFCGIIVMLQPGGATFQPATLIPLGASLFSAVTAIASRSVRTERIDTTLIVSAGLGFAILSCALPGLWHTPTLAECWLGLAMGLLAAAATLAQLLAYRFAPASLLAPFSYTQLIWAGGLGWMMFGTVPGSAMLLGCCVIALGGLLSAWRDREPAPAPMRLLRAETPIVPGFQVMSTLR